MRTHTLSEQCQWHFNLDSEGLSVGREASISSEDADGSWRNATIPASPRGVAFLDSFYRHQKLWHHFLRHSGLEEAQLRRRLEWSTILGPPHQHQMQRPLWTIFINLKTSPLGSMLFTRRYRRKQPPSHQLIRDLKLILNGTRPEPIKLKEATPIHFRGDQLGFFLNRSLTHLPERPNKKGRWQLCQNTLHYVPEQTMSHSNTMGQALLYQADRHLLLSYLPCQKTYQIIQLDEPLYRYFEQMSFLKSQDQVLIGDQVYILPGAILHEKSISESSMMVTGP